MDNQNKNILKELAEMVINEAIVSASEFITVPGNTVEMYVDGLILNYVDTTSMSTDEIELLKEYLVEGSKKEIEENNQ